MYTQSMAHSNPEAAADSLRAYSQLSAEFGSSYLELLKVLSNSDAKEARGGPAVQEIIDSFPQKIQEIIQDAVHRAVKSLRQNEATVKQLLQAEQLIFSPAGVTEFHKRLLAHIINHEFAGDSFQEIYSLLGDAVVVDRVGVGTYLVHLQEEALEQLNTRGFHGGENGRFIEVPTSKGKYSFVVLQENPQDEKTVRSTHMHELHHFFYDALLKSMGLREPREKDETDSQAFVEFRDEAVAYLINASIRDTMDFGGLRAEDLSPTYGGDYQIAKKIYTALHDIEAAYKLAVKVQVSASIFLYPVMSSRSFEELVRNLHRVTANLESLPEQQSKPSPTESKKKRFGFLRRN